MGGGVLGDSIKLSVTHIDGYKLKGEVDFNRLPGVASYTLNTEVAPSL